MILVIQQELEKNNAGIHKTPGTSLVNDTTGEVIFTPPDNPDAIQSLLSNLESFINQDSDIDPLIRMALAHYQFESIHPRTDNIIPKKTISWFSPGLSHADSRNMLLLKLFPISSKGLIG
jgi:hypothetical protein